MTVLEENGGGDGNSSVAELEVRVETLEGTAADHETRITVVEADVDGNNNMNMSHFAYVCKMRYPLNLVLENIEYL